MPTNIMKITNTRIPLTILALQLRAGSYLLPILDRLEVVQWLQFRAKSQVAHQVLSGAGKILFRREIIFGALPLWMRTPAPSLAKMGRLCGRRMAETAGQFKPVAQHKLCGLFPSQMQITELLSAKPAQSLEQQTKVIIGSRSQVEQLFSFVEFRSVTQIMERLWVTVAPFLEPLTAETAGSLNQAGRGIHCSVFPSSIRTRQPRWAEPAESAAKALSSEQQLAATHGRPKQTPERCVFSKFRLPMAIPEPLSAMEA